MSVMSHDSRRVLKEWTYMKQSVVTGSSVVSSGIRHISPVSSVYVMCCHALAGPPGT